MLVPLGLGEWDTCSGAYLSLILFPPWSGPHHTLHMFQTQRDQAALPIFLGHEGSLSAGPTYSSSS